ncbi:MAG: ATP-binding protein [Kofleriaceae bacterium]|nr:ATP-binding protein [Kofleriaceae bacterium]
MTPERLPDAIIARFRTLSLERVGRVEATWNSLIQGVHDDDAIRAMAHDVHTLKGDAKIVGFDEVHALTQKLEELLALAAQQRYAVSEDLELVVTMATQFLGMLLRKKAGGTSGIDLVGFVRQVDEIIRESRTLPTAPRAALPSARTQQRSEASLDRLSEDTRQRLAIAATTIFLEYLGARGGTSRTRLRGVWDTLRHELASIRLAPLAPVLERHAVAARDLAVELGKHVEVDIDIGQLQTDARIAEALDLAVVHMIRNAIDHGIEAPDRRIEAGKPATGTVTVRAREVAGAIELVVSDDGAGLDLDVVRKRAIAGGLLDAHANPSKREIIELVFQPGFSTREEVSEVSGRGVGMDAVRTGVARVGGTVQMDSETGAGSKITLSVPIRRRQIHAYQFLAPGGTLSLAVSARWTPTMDRDGYDNAVDPLAAIQLGLGSRQTSLDLPHEKQDLAVRLRWGFLEVVLKTASEAVLVTAERICPTDDDYPLEVVSIKGQETLLLRPEHLPGMQAPRK